MSVTIPTWVIWTVGSLIAIPLIIFVSACTCVGFMVLTMDWKFK